MPLSKHFYSLDEVQAALFYTAGKYDAKEALFWCKEMIDSGCIGEAISTLFESWLWHKGPFCLSWLLEAWTTLRSSELSEDAILLSVYQLCSVRMKDSSLWNILTLTSCEVDRVTPKTPLLPLENMDEKEVYFLRAIHQGKARSAWWVSCYMEVNCVWWLLGWYLTNVSHTDCNYLEALKGYEDLLGYRSDTYDTIMRCCAVLSVCTAPKTNILPSMDSRMKSAIEEWKKLNGYKARRVYSIPTACLYGMTQRGNMKWSSHNLVQLYCVEKYIIGCPFWDEALSEYSIVKNKVICWKTDELREAFYQKYFPDDIPDEWTLAEKKKSHGDGVLGPTDKVTLTKYARTYFSGQSRLAWSTMKAAQMYLEKRENQDCVLSNVVDCIIAPFVVSLLKPVHKRVKI